MVDPQKARESIPQSITRCLPPMINAAPLWASFLTESPYKCGRHLPRLTCRLCSINLNRQMCRVSNNDQYRSKRREANEYQSKDRNQGEHNENYSLESHSLGRVIRDGRRAMLHHHWNVPSP